MLHDDEMTAVFSVVLMFRLIGVETHNICLSVTADRVAYVE